MITVEVAIGVGAGGSGRTAVGDGSWVVRTPVGDGGTWVARSPVGDIDAVGVFVDSDVGELVVVVVGAGVEGTATSVGSGGGTVVSRGGMMLTTVGVGVEVAVTNVGVDVMGCDGVELATGGVPGTSVATAVGTAVTVAAANPPPLIGMAATATESATESAA